METNRLIAEFIGYIKYSELHQGLYCEETCELGEFENLKSYSWKWLMKAVDKIEDMGCEVVIANCACTILCPNDYSYITTGKKRQDAVYDAVVEFIIDHKKPIKKETHKGYYVLNGKVYIKHEKDLIKHLRSIEPMECSDDFLLSDYHKANYYEWVEDKYLIEDTEEVTLGEINQYFRQQLAQTSLNKDDIVIDENLKIKIAMVELARIFDENGMDGIYEIDLGTIHLNHTGNTIAFSQEEILYRFENAYDCILSGIQWD